jgi:hypothetical protein
MPNFIEAEGYQIEAPEYFFDCLSTLKNNIVSEIKSLSELKKIHKEFGINRY